MFNPSDVYVSGGADDLLVCWTDKVTTFDGSSVYNWEHDNLPIHDLEERTHLLWEKFGHPTSALTGMSFVVSADATSSCSPTYFTTLSSCLDALPEVINYPILVEVASFGDLGTLNVSNKSFGSNGSLEIVNRQFGLGAGLELGGETINVQENDSTTTYGFLASSYTGNGPNGDVNNAALTTTLAANNFTDHIMASVYSTGQLIASGNGYDDTRFASTPVSVFTRNIDRKNNRMTAAIKSTGTVGGEIIPWEVGGTEHKINFQAFDLDGTNRTNELMASYDVSTVNEIGNTEIVWGVDSNPPDAGADNAGFGAACYSYINTLDSINITNCDGPIYIRNFHVDGGTTHTTENGISIKNSNVNLENCAATRCSNAGLYASNSYVKLLRGFVAFRCYGFDTTGNRIGTNYADKRTLENTKQDSYGAGIKSLNSTIEFANTFNRDYQQSSEALSITGRSRTWAGYTTSFGGESPTPNSGNLFCISRSDIGIEALNSVLLGGRTEVSGLSGTAGSLWMDSSQLFLESNSEAGLKAFNSTISYDGRLNLYGNHRGIDATNCDIEVDVLKAQYNQREAIKLDGCNFTYGKESYPGYLHTATGPGYTTARSWDFDQVTLKENGKHIYAKNSTIKPLMVSSMPDTYQGFFVSGSIGTEFGRSSSKVSPAIHLDNSNADLVHLTVLRENVAGTNESSYGDAILANNNSNVILRGSNRYATRILGPTSILAQSRKAGVTAINNSSIRMQGPTVIAGFAVDALADKNSLIAFEPHRDINGSLLVSAFDLEEPANHTMVELHSTRACLVADHGSVIDMEDLGSYHGHWLTGSYGSGIPLAQYDYLKNSETNTQAYVNNVSGGYLQFYANSSKASVSVNYDTPAPDLATQPNFADDPLHPAKLSLSTNASGYLYGYTAAELDISAITTGGMCVRALNNSNVEVNNVHFPAGWVNPSAAYYDISGPLGACSRPHIWNIADTSLLNAKYVTVSGVHPRDAGYYGPSGNWGNSGAPAGTPDTSSLSVLDYYGADTSNENAFGQDVTRNFGAFRLYFSVDPVTNFLVDPTTVVSGVAYQIFSQGYNFSGNLSAPGTVSAFYTSILEMNASQIPTPSSFYYASAMVHSPGVIKAVLDDSASNTFANAKHNSVGKSGLAKLVHIYNAYDEVFGGDSVITKTDADGLGSVNNFNLEKDN